MKIIRRIIKIDEELCNGCGNCIVDCHEAAIIMENGKAKVIKDSLCDGMGDCMGRCPTNAITMEEREADAYNEEEVKRRIAMSKGGYPLQWPLKIRLVSPAMDVFQGADLVIAADCAAFADPEFHQTYRQGSPIIIGCPKFDDTELYRQRFEEIFRNCNLNSCTVVRMSVPCCGWLAKCAQDAADAAGIELKVKIVEVVR